MMSDKEKEDDLYGDLLDTKPAASRPAVPTAQPLATLALDAQVTTLRAQVKHLQKDNEILKRNIGMLFRTAKAEMERKDEEIQGLSEKLLEQTRQQQQEQIN